MTGEWKTNRVRTHLKLGRKSTFGICRHEQLTFFFEMRNREKA